MKNYFYILTLLLSVSLYSTEDSNSESLPINMDTIEQKDVTVPLQKKVGKECEKNDSSQGCQHCQKDKENRTE